LQPLAPIVGNWGIWKIGENGRQYLFVGPTVALRRTVVVRPATFWATAFDPEQLYAAGKYPNQYPNGYTDGLVGYADDRSIDNQDVVVWYSMGFTHVTRAEDFPIMPGETLAVDFKPHNFFEKSAALGYARTERVDPDV